MPTKTINEQLKSLGACPEAIRWVGDLNLSQAWDQCQRGDWMLWYIAKIGVDKKLVVMAACKCARLSLKYTTDVRPLKAIETAEAWCRGEATKEEVKVVTNAAAHAHAAARVDAYAAAHADVAARAAVYAANAAAYATNAAYAAATNAANAAAYVATTNAAYAAAYVATTAANAAAVYAANAAADAAYVGTLNECAKIVRQIITLEILNDAKQTKDLVDKSNE